MRPLFSVLVIALLTLQFACSTKPAAEPASEAQAPVAESTYTPPPEEIATPTPAPEKKSKKKSVQRSKKSAKKKH